MRQNRRVSLCKYLQIALICTAPLSWLNTGLADETPTQETTAQILAADEFAIPAPAQDSSDSYDLLVRAGKIIDKADPGTPGTAEKLSSAEDLRRQRAFTKKNAASLDMMQEALQKPIVAPSGRNFFDLSSLSSSGALRELARLSVQNNRVAAADKQWKTAINGALDIVQMGIGIENHAIVIGVLTSAYIQNTGRDDMWNWIEHSDSATALDAAQRLEKLDAATPSFVAIMKEEKWIGLSMLKEMLASPEWKNFRQGNDTEIAKTFDNPADVKKLRQFSDRDILRHYIATMDAVIAQAEQPFKPKPTPIAAAADPYSDMYTSSYTVSMKQVLPFSYRAIMEKARAENRLLLTALALHAFQKDNGHYPEKLDELRGKYLQEIPRDPFASDAPLSYKRDDANYTLYSIGTDGVDNGGVTAKRGAPDENGVVPPPDFDAPGDLVAGQFQ